VEESKLSHIDGYENNKVYSGPILEYVKQTLKIEVQPKNRKIR
jgi:hypothetical protein